MSNDAEALQKRMLERIAQIPLPNLDASKKNQLLQQNRERDRQNTDHTLKILTDRQKEAVDECNTRKYFHSIAIAKNESGEYQCRERDRALSNRMDELKKHCADYWIFFEMYSELRHPNFWQAAEKNGYKATDKAQYYRDVFQIPASIVVKFLEYLKLWEEYKALQQ